MHGKSIYKLIIETAQKHSHTFLNNLKNDVETFTWRLIAHFLNYSGTQKSVSFITFHREKCN